MLVLNNLYFSLISYNTSLGLDNYSLYMIFESSAFHSCLLPCVKCEQIEHFYMICSGGHKRQIVRRFRVKFILTGIIRFVLKL